MPSSIPRPARLYNWDAMRDAPEGVGAKAQAMLQKHAPPRHTTLSGVFYKIDGPDWSTVDRLRLVRNIFNPLCIHLGTSTLMKALAWQLERPFAPDEVMVHQVRFSSVGVVCEDHSGGIGKPPFLY